jgi:hypothetical protein
MDVGSSFGADVESSEAFEPGEGAFDRPSDCAQAGAVFDAAAGDDGRDPAGADQAPVLVVVVAAVCVEPARTATWFADHAVDRRDRVDERDQLGDVVAVPAGECDGQWDAARVGDQGVLGAGLAAVDRARPGVVPPLSARRGVESTRAADRSSRPAARSSASSSSCSCCQPPASCHSVNRRQQVEPEAPNKAAGSRFQPMPVRTA